MAYTLRAYIYIIYDLCVSFEEIDYINDYIW